eukprot:g4423.t2
MARRRSGGARSFSTSSARRSPPPTPTSRIVHVSHFFYNCRLGAPPPAQQQQKGGLFSGLMGSVMHGAALGTGSAIAHRAIDGVMGGRGEAPVPVSTENELSPEVCKHQAKAFTDCITENNGEMGACQFYFDMLQQCKIENPQ